MKKHIKWMLAFWGICLSMVSYSQDPNFHIYLCFGQSNMEGMGPIEAQDKATNVRVKVLADQTCSNLNRVYGQWYTAVPPLNRCWNALGPADYFGKTMADGEPSKVTIGLVPAAYSGCDIAFFQKSAPLGKASTKGGGAADIPSQFTGGYAWLLDLAKKAQKVGVIKGIIFHQGETNSGDPTWKNKVKEIVTDLRTDLGIGNVPFLAGELLYAQYGGCCSSHNVEVNKLPGLLPNAYVISASGLNGLSGSNAHFSSASYRTLGARYAQKMLAVEVVTDVESPEAFNQTDLALFPLPCKDHLTIQVPDAFTTMPNVISLHTMDGRLILKEENVSSNRVTINTSRLESTMYLLKLSANGSSVVKKFIKAE
jgi:hypothetical protein